MSLNLLFKFCAGAPGLDTWFIVVIWTFSSTYRVLCNMVATSQTQSALTSISVTTKLFTCALGMIVCLYTCTEVIYSLCTIGI